MDEAGVAEVVKSTAGEDLATSLEPHTLAHRYTLVLGKDLGGQASCCAEHSPAGVDDLDLAVAAECLRVGGKASGVLHIAEL